ncbi:hypothetical protein GOP47_0015607 [Adiantum capillus-veneris]|uniref:Uncharacterized protein n=1 Tax=Adiantum capillus-veneris TaxID=13818 RepID=A0A9D4UK12_ADICA|nr:hypothetical protein GOP47_0015607 [Adiantum capillus-veneris]
MSFNSLCSVYPLLGHQQHELVDSKQTPTLPLILQSLGKETSSSSKPYLEESVTLMKGPWTEEEDKILLAYVKRHGEGNWNFVRKYSGFFRCAKSCRLRWINHLRPGLRRGPLQPHEERLIIEQHETLGDSWSRIAAMLPGRTDNEIRLLRACLPLYPPPEAVEETVEDVGEDICATRGPSNYNLASLRAVGSPSDNGFNLLNWSCSAVNVAEMMSLKPHALPAVLSEDFSGLEKTVGSTLHDTGMRKRNVSSGKKSSAIDFSDVTVMQPLCKRRCVEPHGGIILDPIDSCDSSPNTVCDSFPGCKLSCGIECGYSASNTTNNNFATIRLDKGLPGLKVELHSVQRHEAANSSSALSSSLAAAQPKKPGHEQLTSVVGDESFAVPVMDVPASAVGPRAKDVAQTANDNLLAPLGGFSLVPFEDDFSSGALQSDSGSYLSVELPADLCENSAWTVPLLYQEDVTASAIASNVADGGYSGNGDSPWDLSSCVWSNMPGISQAYPAPASEDHQ